MAVSESLKLYCYVDETGQDIKSEFFIVVAVVSDQDQNQLRRQLTKVEEVAQTNQLKWHKTEHRRRMKYLSLVLERNIAKGSVYIARYQKPIPYFFPVIDVLERAIKKIARGKYQARIYIDGIDRHKAKELTNALRVRGISLRIVKSRRDESEPLIRLADMWAGCVRSALLQRKDTREIFQRAKQEGYLYDLNT